MEIINLRVGLLDTNCYILVKGNKALVIDPGANKKLILETIKDLEVVGILLTHNHYDHTGALKPLLKKYNLEVNKPVDNTFTFDILSNPGHTEDSSTFYFKEEKAMFTGDFIFHGAIGRTDLPGGSFKKMHESLKNFLQYPDEITIYPGHGISSVLGIEKENYRKYL